MTKPTPPSGGASGGAYTVITGVDAGLSIARIRDFVVVGGTDDAVGSGDTGYYVRWSAINDGTDWPTPETDDARSKQSGQQSFPTKFGFITAVTSGDFFGYVFQEKAITKMTYVGGDVVFSFDTFEEDRGCVAQGRYVQVDDKVFFQSQRGYHMLEAGQIADISYGIVEDSF